MKIHRMLHTVVLIMILISGNLVADISPLLPRTEQLIAQREPDGRPQYKKRVKPKYPKEAIESAIEGRVVLQVTIDINGLPKDIVALTKIGFGFEEAAIEALKKTTFHPAIKNGRAVEVRVNAPYEFKLASSNHNMVLIPAGEFQMGSNSGDSDEEPLHTVYLNAFYIDKYEVTNVQFKRFVDENPQWQKDKISSQHHDGYYLADWIGNYYPSGKGNHPVVYVSWYAAMAYAKWTKKRLPTEAEWEKAARGGLVSKKYPWGDTIGPTNANYFDGTGKEITPVGSYQANGYGLFDMAGNVREWCLDAYDENFFVSSPRENPLAGAKNVNEITTNFISQKDNRVLRGGSWLNSAQLLRISNRHWRAPTATNPNEGFRCVKSVTQNYENQE